MNDERAFISEIPGTTRDAIEDTIILNGLEYRFIDTAGLRDTSDVIESMGIRKTHEKIMQAAVILLVDEVTDSPEMIVKRADSIRKMTEGSGKKLIILINKIDKAAKIDPGGIRKKIRLENGESLLFISAKNSTGLEGLRKTLGDSVEAGRADQEGVIITNLRHYEALLHVSESLGRVISGFDDHIPEDLIAIDIRQAIHYLGEITGEITTDEILDNIFKNFCIGK